MPVVVDTYNVLHVVGILPPDLAGPGVEDLADLVASSRYRAQTVTLVCDGIPREGRRPGPAAPGSPVILRFAGRGVTADDVIAGMIRDSSAPRRLTVVSSDRAVLRAARRRRCPTLTSEEFLGHLAADHAGGARTGRADAPPDHERVLPPEVVDEAKEILARPPEEPATEAPAPEPDRADAPQPPPPIPLPSRILREAERLWREGADEQSE